MDRDTPQSRKAAAKKLRLKIAEKGAASDLTFSELCRIYLADQQHVLKDTTLRRNRSVLNALDPRFGKIRVESLTSGTIRALLLDISDNPVTLNNYIVRLKAMLRWAYRNDHISSTACIDKLESFKEPVQKKERSQNKSLERSELLAVLNEASDYYRPVIEFMALSGLRIGEVVALNDEDVDLHENVIRVNKTYDIATKKSTTPKTLESNREVHIQPELARCIHSIRKTSNRNRLISRMTKMEAFIVNPYGGRFSYVKFNREFKELCERCAGKSLTTHALRHTHTSLLAEQGVPLETIARRLGHSDSKLTKEIYLHVTENVKKADALILDRTNIIGL